MRRVARRRLRGALEPGERRLVLLCLELPVRGAERILHRQGGLALDIEAGIRADPEVTDGLRRVGGKRGFGFLGFEQALIGAVALGGRVHAVARDVALGRLAPGQLDLCRLAEHLEAADALRRLQILVDRELLAPGIVKHEVISRDRDGQRGLAGRLDLRRPVGGEREVELGSLVDVDDLLRALGRSEHVEAAVAVHAQAVDGLVAALGAQRVAPFARGGEDLHGLAVRIGDIEVARGIGDDGDRPSHPPRRFVAAIGICQLGYQDAVAREQLHAAVAAVGDVKIVGKMQPADIRELAVARARAPDREAQAAVVRKDPDAAAVGDGDLARIDRGALRALDLIRESGLQLARAIQARDPAVAGVEAQQVAVGERVSAVALDARGGRSPDAWQPLRLRCRRRGRRQAEELDLAVADVRDGELAPGDRQRGDFGKLSAALAGAAEAPAHLAALPVELGDIAVLAVGDEEAPREVRGERAPAGILAAGNRFRGQPLEQAPDAVVHRDAARTGLLEHVNSLRAIDRDLERLDERAGRVLAGADRMQEDAELRINADPVVALVRDVEPPADREGKALRIAELAGAAAARREHALCLALRVDDRQQVVARVRHRDAAGPEPGDAAELLRFERQIFGSGNRHRGGGVVRNAPQRAALAVGDEHAAVRREREAAEVLERAALPGLPGAQELHLRLLRHGRRAEQQAKEPEPRIAGIHCNSPLYALAPHGIEAKEIARNKSVGNSSTRPHGASRRNRHHPRHDFAFFDR